MLIVKANAQGRDVIPMSELQQTLARLGYNAAAQPSALKNFIVALKNKFGNLVADVNDTEVVLSKLPDPEEEETEKQEDDVKQQATANARKALGL